MTQVIIFSVWFETMDKKISFSNINELMNVNKWINSIFNYYL